MKIETVRICLNEDGTVTYYPWYKETEDYGDEPLPPLEALRLITAGNVPIEIATNDPDDKRPHNYEINSQLNTRLRRI